MLPLRLPLPCQALSLTPIAIPSPEPGNHVRGARLRARETQRFVSAPGRAEPPLRHHVALSTHTK